MSSPKQPHLNGAYYGPSIPPPSKSYHRPGRGTSCNPLSCLCGCIFNCFFKILFSILLTLALVLFLFWLAFRPTRVKFHVTDASLTQFSLNSTNTTGGSTLYYDLDLNLTIRNPNKHIGIYYDSIEARAFYGGQRFAAEPLPRFYQRKKNTTELNVAFQGQNIVVNDVSKYNSEQGSGIYSIDVKLYLRVRFKLRAIKTPRFKPKIECDLKVPLDSNGKASSGTFETTKCGFDW